MQQHLIPELSLAERNRRWAAVQDLMALRSLDALVIWGSSAKMDNKSANVRYLCNLGGSNEEIMVIMPLEGDPVAYVVHPARVPHWKKIQSWTATIGYRAGSWAETVQKGLAELGIRRGHIGLVGGAGSVHKEGDITHEMMVGFQECLTDFRLANATDLLEQVRLIKSDEEIGFLRKAGQITDAMLQAVIDHARPGEYQDTVFAKMIEAMLANEGEYAPMVLWDVGQFPSIHPGHGPWHQKLELGDVITTEFHSRYGGYMAHCERAICVGKPRPEFQRIFDVSLESYWSGFRAIRDGATVGDVERAYREPIARAGITFTECGLHGHGIETGEYPMFVFPPTPGGWGGRTARYQLRAGMVFGVVIDLRDQTWNDETGLMFGDTILVTKTGCERLCNFPLELHHSL